MIDAKNRSIHKWNRLPAFYAHFDRLEAISYPTSRFKMERIRIFLRPNGRSVYLAQANGLGTEFNIDTIGPTARQLFVLVGPTNGRAFGPNRLFGRGFLGRWPRLGKQMALWAETIGYKFSLILVAIKWLKANPTAVASSSALLALNSPAIARTCRDSGHFIRFMAQPLNFVAITTDTSDNTLAAPVADRATSPLDDEHQGRVIFCALPICVQQMRNSLYESTLPEGLAVGMSRPDQKVISNRYGLQPSILQSWMHHFVYVRNLCAHHSRLWDRVWAIKPTLPHGNDWAAPNLRSNRHLLATLMLLRYWLKRIPAANRFAANWKIRVEQHLQSPPSVATSDIRMGLTQSWMSNPVWK